MKREEKVSIFIDAANFYHLVLKKMNTKELNFVFDKFVKFLADGREISETGKRFYVGTVREEHGNLKSKQAMSSQTTLFTILKNHGWKVETSKLRKRIETIIIDERVDNYKNILKHKIKKITFKRFREKGVDVKLATDLIIGAIDREYDTAIIVSSDTDLVPAIDLVRKRQNIKIEYIGFSIGHSSLKWKNTKPSQGMITHSDSSRTLIISDIKPFIIEIRKAKVLDSRLIIELEKEYYDGNSIPEEMLTRWIKNSNFFVLEENSKIVGSIYFEFLDEIKDLSWHHNPIKGLGKYIYISEISVDSKEKISILFRKVLKVAKKNDCEAIIWLTGEKANHDRIERKFLKANNFDKFKQIEKWECAPEYFIDDHSLWLRRLK